MARFQLTSLVSLFVLLTSTLTSAKSLRSRQLAAELQAENGLKHQVSRRETNTSDFRFYNNDTAPYYVESLPLIDLDIGEFYAGMMPVNDSLDASMFFIFQPTVGEPVDEITIWFNGGPGCSSLEGFLQENGMFQWAWGMYNAEINPYSWPNLTNMLWVEFPLGVGYSGDYSPSATTEEEIAQDFLGFFMNFQDMFGIQNFKIYVTGESYAGRYVPYVADAMIAANDTSYFNVSGALLYDPEISNDYVQLAVPIVPFIYKYNDFLNYNETFMSQLTDLHSVCGFADYIDKYYKFPPSGPQPGNLSLNSTGPDNVDCDVWHLAYKEAYKINNCFNVYEINVQCPLMFDPLGFPSDIEYLAPAFGDYVYFDRDDVKTALHATNTTWAECNGNAFNSSAAPDTPYGDTSEDSIASVLPRVIEKTQRVFIGSADYDMELPTLGTMLAIQNMTWGGKMGFQQMPSAEINLQLEDLAYADILNNSGLGGFDGYPGTGQGIMGTQHFERGLMWATTRQSGHMWQPQFQPRASYRHLQWLLGHIETL